MACLVGCASFQTTSGKFLASTAQSVDLAMKGWALFVVEGKVTAQQQLNVRSAYAMYQRSMLVASNAWETSLTTADKTLWNSASNSVYFSQQGLVNLLTAMQVQEPVLNSNPPMPK